MKGTPSQKKAIKLLKENGRTSDRIWASGWPN